MISIREVFPRSVWSVLICMKKRPRQNCNLWTDQKPEAALRLNGFPPLTRKRLSWGAFAAVALEVRKMYPLRPNGAILWSPYSTWAGSNRKEADCLWISTPTGLAGIPQEDFFYSCEQPFMLRAVCVRFMLAAYLCWIVPVQTNCIISF